MRIFRDHIIASRKEVWALRDRLTEIELLAENCLHGGNPPPSIKVVQQILDVVRR